MSNLNSVPYPMMNNNLGAGASILQQRLRNPPEPVHGSPRGSGMQYSGSPAFSMSGPNPQYMIPQEHGTPQQPAYYTVQGHGQAPFYQGDPTSQQPEYHSQPSHLQHVMVGAVSPGRAPSVTSQRSATSPPPPVHERPDKPPRSPGLFAAELKPPKAPEKPLIPYLRFSKSVWETVKRDHPTLPFAEIGRVIGEQWRNCPEDVKQKIIDEYNRDKEKHALAQKAYLESPEYQEYLAHKVKREQMDEENERASRRREEQAKLQPMTSAPPQRNVSSGGQTTGAPSGSSQPLHGPLEELQSMSQRILPPKPSSTGTGQGDRPSVEPDEDADDYLRAKHVASLRYQRNHKLMAELFSDAIVPDGRMVVNEQRITLLRKQVQSLGHHQERLLMDQKELMEKQETKKRKLMDDGENFRGRWAQVKEECKPVSKEQYQALVDKHYKAYEKWIAEHHMQNQGKSQAEMQPSQLTPSTDVSFNVSTEPVAVNHSAAGSVSSPHSEPSMIIPQMQTDVLMTEPISSPGPPATFENQDQSAAVSPRASPSELPQTSIVSVSDVISHVDLMNAFGASESAEAAASQALEADAPIAPEKLMDSTDSVVETELHHTERLLPVMDKMSVEDSFINAEVVHDAQYELSKGASPKNIPIVDTIPVNAASEVSSTKPDRPIDVSESAAAKCFGSPPSVSKPSPPVSKLASLIAYSDDSNSNDPSETEHGKAIEMLESPHETVDTAVQQNVEVPTVTSCEDEILHTEDDQKRSFDDENVDRVTEPLESGTPSDTCLDLAGNADDSTSIESQKGTADQQFLEPDKDLTASDISEKTSNKTQTDTSSQEEEVTVNMGGGQGYADYIL